MNTEPLREQLDQVIAPGGAIAAVVPTGSLLRLSQVEGLQVADLVSFRLDALHERLSMFRSRSHNASWQLRAGHVLTSTTGRPMWTIVEDTVGENYTGGGYCNPRVNQRRYGVPGEATCEGNLVEVLGPYGLDRHGFDPDTCFNIFMNVGYDESGEWVIRATAAGPSDVIVLRAEMDQLIGLSNCPQVLSDVNARGLKRLRLQITSPTGDPTGTEVDNG